MKMKFDLSSSPIGGGCVTVTREPGDRKYYGLRFAAGEHGLFHNIKKWLNDRGFDCIKKRAQKDGHMIGDEYQPYIRTRSKASKSPHIYLWSGFYALRGANDDYNKGSVTLIVDGNIYEKQANWAQRIAELGEKYEFEVVISKPERKAA